MKRTFTVLATSTLVALAISGCGGSTSPSVTVTAPASVVTETVAPSSATPALSTPAPAASTPAVAESTPPAADAGQIVVPNGVGKDYQTAQDLWRAAGLVVAPATDATGANRLPIIDSNWVVVAQDLKAGSKVAADSFITATVKKYTDN